MASILVVTDSPEIARSVMLTLGRAGHRLELAEHSSRALELLRQQPFDLIVSDLHMPEIDGVRLSRIIRAGVYQTLWTTPIILVSAALDEALSVDLLDETGISDFIHMPCDPKFLVDRVTHLLTLPGDAPVPVPSRSEARSILLVDDEAEFLGLLTSALGGLGYRLLTALNGEQALKILHEERITLVLLDYLLPDINGIMLLKEIRRLQPQSLVVMLTGHGSQEIAVEALWAGAADYLEKPVQNQVLRRTLVDVLRRGHSFQMAGFLSGQIRLLRDQAQRIERLKRLNEAIVGSLPDPLCVLDGEWRIVAANPEFWTAFGISQDPGGPRSFSSVLPNPALAAAIEQVAAGGRPFSGVEFEVGRGEGVMRCYRARIMPLMGGQSSEETGAEGNVMLLLQDVTEERRAARIEEQLRAEQESTRMMSTFVQMLSGAAHELNNPLAVIMGLSDLGRSEDTHSTPQQTADMFGRIFQQSRRCQKIVKDLTAFLSAERTMLRPGNIYDVLEKAIEKKRGTLESGQIRVTMPARLPLPNAAMNEGEIERVFDQVLDNACRAFQEAGRGGEIRVSMGLEPARPRDLVSVEIANDGPSIPEENLQRIFLPFVTSRNVGEGTGLGLAVCYGIVRNHGGKIRARNLPEGGCAFKVWLPVASGMPLLSVS